MPFRKPELIITPSSVKAVSSMVKLAASGPSGATTATTGRPYLRAKSRSRWSPEGQPKIAPVP
jgi:hypothetical protein